MASSNRILQLLFILESILLVTMGSCNGMVLKKNTTEKSTDFSEDLEQKFNKTVVKAVETKTFLLDVMSFSINKTANVLLVTKQHLKEAKDTLKTKMLASANKTAHKLEEIKDEMHSHKRTKTTTKQPFQILYVTRDYLLAPVIPMVNEAATSPMSSSEVWTNFVPTGISNNFA
ncbi:uncharacterized protein LOC130704016 [Daphnia carinata]|uniref:uncharacterized protein LOC130704016 n=1 Tax=Daphnia carinata TaxID=120202 RepID=UPI00257B8EE1|nr:uncharacterized protein LOC130704016 [Daphnia carinata]